MNLAILILVIFGCLSLVYMMYRQSEIWRVVRILEKDSELLFSRLNKHTHNIADIEGK